MILKLFKNHSPVTILLLLLVYLGYWLNIFIFQHTDLPANPHQSSHLYNWFGGLFSNYPTVSSAIAFFLIAIQSFIIERINSKFMVIEGRTYLPALFFMIICSSFKDMHYLNPAIIANFFILFAFYKLIDSHKKHKANSIVFDTFLLLSIASLIYPPTVYLLPVFFAGITILRPFIFSEWIIALTGYLTPLVICYAFYFINDEAETLLNPFINSLTFNRFYFQYETFEYIYIGVLGLTALISLFSTLSIISSKKINIRKYFSFIVWFFVISIAATILAYVNSYEMIAIVAMPLTFLLSSYFNSQKGIFTEIIFSAFLFASFLAIYL
ncbi:MAG: hypothetical protein C0594_01920 [Marinilabiliales bacterium]|nr:MAG: hypothetical protein C0594_01920 [Marinilabiliales bacterium]